MNAEPLRPWDSSVMRLNVSMAKLLGNISTNIAKPLPQVMAYQENPEHIAIVGGGWSLDDTFEELRDLYFQGVKLIALNGSARWLMARNLKPAMHIMLDARPENIEFVADPIPDCRYILASQCDPSVIDACLGRDLRLFHVVGDDSPDEKEILDAHYFGRWQPVPSAGTVGVTALMLCRILGFRFQHLFGMDSCTAPDGRHHGYPQPLNDNDGWAIFHCAGREFRCSAWQAAQAQNFIDMIRVNGELFELSIHGDGLLAYLLRTGADLSAHKVTEA